MDVQTLGDCKGEIVQVKIKTRPYGEVEISEDEIIVFSEGIPGFDFINKFVVLESADDAPFKWLQSVDNPDLAFTVIQPIDFMAEYSLVISSSDLEDVGAGSADELTVYAIVTIPADPKRMTANLQGPIIINQTTRLGKQAISLSDKYHVRHVILDEIQKLGDGE